MLDFADLVGLLPMTPSLISRLLPSLAALVIPVMM
jgi:hypothetical protein